DTCMVSASLSNRGELTSYVTFLHIRSTATPQNTSNVVPGRTLTVSPSSSFRIAYIHTPLLFFLHLTPLTGIASSPGVVYALSSDFGWTVQQ
ncbi:hypothetical protein PMAYCL1PPCAC_09526, partial [Pristionchus mayeri]